MRLHRFLINQPLGEETFIEDRETVHQIKNVLRLSEGDTLVLFDGQNPFDMHYTITHIVKDKIQLKLMQKEAKELDVAGKTILFLSVIRKELFELACLKCTELGVTDIVPVVSERTQKNFLNPVRIENILKEGTEQSGRFSLPKLHNTITLKEAISLLDYFAVEQGHAYSLSLLGTNPISKIGSVDVHKNLAFFVGPEGGWNQEEEGLFKTSDIIKLRVARYVLRAETAAIVCTYLSFLLRK